VLADATSRNWIPNQGFPYVSGTMFLAPIAIGECAVTREAGIPARRHTKGSVSAELAAVTGTTASSVAASVKTRRTGEPPANRRR
jgi:hypothetical protein